MYRHRLKRSAFVMIVMICALSIISFAKYYPFASLKASQDTFTITNETDVLQIVSSKVEKRDLVVELKNTGKRRILAYAFDTKSKKSLTIDLGENGILPGSTSRIQTPLDNLERTGDGTYTLNLSMAFFDDGSSEGDWSQTRDQRERLEGAALALEQIQAKVKFVTQFSPPAISSLSDELKRLVPAEQLNQMRRAGYDNVIVQSLVKMRLLLQEKTPEKAARDFHDFQSSLTRRTSRVCLLAGRRIAL